jgi:hypothetical protein
MDSSRRAFCLHMRLGTYRGLAGLGSADLEIAAAETVRRPPPRRPPGKSSTRKVGALIRVATSNDAGQLAEDYRLYAVGAYLLKMTGNAGALGTHIVPPPAELRPEAAALAQSPRRPAGQGLIVPDHVRYRLSVTTSSCEAPRVAPAGRMLIMKRNLLRCGLVAGPLSLQRLTQAFSRNGLILFGTHQSAESGCARLGSNRQLRRAGCCMCSVLSGCGRHCAKVAAVLGALCSWSHRCRTDLCRSLHRPTPALASRRVLRPGHQQ